MPRVDDRDGSDGLDRRAEEVEHLDLFERDVVGEDDVCGRGKQEELAEKGRERKKKERRTSFVPPSPRDSSDRNPRTARRSFKDARAGVGVYQALFFRFLDDCARMRGVRRAEGRGVKREGEGTHS